LEIAEGEHVVKPAIYVDDDGCEGDGERNLGEKQILMGSPSKMCGITWDTDKCLYPQKFGIYVQSG